MTEQNNEFKIASFIKKTFYIEADKDVPQLVVYARYIRNLRYLAYSNEVGESFRGTFNKIIPLSYFLSFAYIGADITHHMHPFYDKYGMKDQKTLKALSYYGAWHTFASLVLPTFTIGASMKLTKKALLKFGAKARTIRYSLPAVGLGIIPFIVHPIDELTDDIIIPNIFGEYKPICE